MRISDWSSDVCSSDLIYAASLPDPGELAKRIEAGGISARPPAPTGTTGGPEPAAALAEAPASGLTIAQIHQLLESGGHHQLARQVHDDLRVVTLEPGTLVFAPAPALGEAVARALSDALFAATGSRWQVRAGEGDARPSLKDVRDARIAEIGRAHVELQSLMRISYAVFCLKKKKH